MKFLSALAILSTLALAKPVQVKTGDLLFEKTFGGQANQGASLSCKIFTNHPDVQENLEKIVAAIEAASTADFERRVYVKAHVPSEETYAYLTDDKGKSTRVKLLLNYSQYEKRQGKDAEYLFKQIDELCTK